MSRTHMLYDDSRPETSSATARARPSRRSRARPGGSWPTATSAPLGATASPGPHPRPRPDQTSTTTLPVLPPVKSRLSASVHARVRGPRAPRGGGAFEQPRTDGGLGFWKARHVVQDDEASMRPRRRSGSGSSTAPRHGRRRCRWRWRRRARCGRAGRAGPGTCRGSPHRRCRSTGRSLRAQLAEPGADVAVLVVDGVVEAELFGDEAALLLRARQADHRSRTLDPGDLADCRPGRPGCARTTTVSPPSRHPPRAARSRPSCRSHRRRSARRARDLLRHRRHGLGPLAGQCVVLPPGGAEDESPTV